ncbi:sugar transferase [Streptococcus danieliae]|uniref:Sugar transferase n=1 Tax=Streptococcus danieliae TaxID=747656 RepID=A0A7Z0LD41_9STRE|nr:sugar transferase [Streptococcus danieliae]MBF0717257.1 sugar transferase [Streptococcus danieliae]NYS49187.1 sugar transferase [Streptococcus danieliae]
MKKLYQILNIAYLHFGKRLLDIAIGLIGTMLIFLPTLLVIALFYQFGRNRGPIFFRQKRAGKNGEIFEIIKFRSMIVNAEQVLKENKELYQKYLDNSYKLTPEEDPRLTSIGAFIRKTSIDEFPQFWNVLRGDMSFIGPRPVIIEELTEYTEEQRPRFLSVKPGATGWWQVSGRSDVFYPERCELELYYVEHYSLELDFKILFLTFAKVLKRSGAI